MSEPCGRKLADFSWPSYIWRTVGSWSDSSLASKDRVTDTELSAQYLCAVAARLAFSKRVRSEEHTSELQSRENLVCRLLLEKKNLFAGRETSLGLSLYYLNSVCPQQTLIV